MCGKPHGKGTDVYANGIVSNEVYRHGTLIASQLVREEEAFYNVSEKAFWFKDAEI